MFNRKTQGDKDSRTSPPLRLDEAQPIRSKNVSVIRPTLVFKEELSADEDLVIKNTIEGTIAHHKKNLTIGAKGRISADIHANSILVEGQLDNDIHSDGLVSLAKSATVNGNINCARLVLQDGARFNGKVVIKKQSPLKIAPKPKTLDDSHTGSEKNKSA